MNATAGEPPWVQASGDASGVRSYGEVTDLLVSWHYQREILPTLVHQEQKFDPYDENQVDLSGIVNAKDPKPPVSDDGGIG